MNKARKDRKRRRLYDLQKGKCYYCGCRMRILQRRGTPPKDMATFEHLDSKLNPERGQHPGERRVVLACFACNQERGTEEVAALPLAEKHRRSGRSQFPANRAMAIALGAALGLSACVTTEEKVVHVPVEFPCPSIPPPEIPALPERPDDLRDLEPERYIIESLWGGIETRQGEYREKWEGCEK